MDDTFPAVAEEALLAPSSRPKYLPNLQSFWIKPSALEWLIVDEGIEGRKCQEGVETGELMTSQERRGRKMSGKVKGPLVYWVWGRIR